MIKTCFVAIVGRPNVGKSSLLNKILNYNLAITSPKPQTTRNQINGIYNDKDYQIIFVDTPGIHKSDNKLGDHLNKTSYDSLKDIDVVLFLQPANQEIGKGDEMIIDQLVNIKNKIALITKVDLVNDMEVLNKKAQLLKDMGFNLVLGTSTKIKNTIQDLIEEIKKYTYESEPFYNEDDITDRSMRFIAKEIIRESAINHLDHELPHKIYVEIHDFKELETSIEIEAFIYVAKESQKKILIGAKGQKIKEIGQAARLKMQDQFDTKVVLKTLVKVKNNWINNEMDVKKSLDIF